MSYRQNQQNTDTVLLGIERLAYGNDSIAHLEDGKTVFVAGGCPGDSVLARITEDKARFARADVVEVVEPSPLRVKEACPYATQCGGCPWQHIAYDAQLESKRDAVRDALMRIGGFSESLIDDVLQPAIASPRTWGYRNKVEFDVSNKPPLGLGLHANKGGFVAVDSCMLIAKQHRSIPKAIRGALRYLQGSTSLPAINRVGVRYSAHTKDAEIALWTETGSFPRKACAQVLSSVHSPTSIVRVMTASKGRKVKGVEVLAGRGFWREQLDTDRYAISAPSFFQVNTGAAELLRATALEALSDVSNKRVFDLYSGAGTFTLPLAQAGAEVYAVEYEGSSLRDLQRNLQKAGTAAYCIGGDVAHEIGSLGTADAVLIDPPRAGLGPGVADALCDTHAERIVYVSCDPSTLARDLKMLCRECYRLESVTPIDLFPQTYHVETVVQLTRTQS